MFYLTYIEDKERSGNMFSDYGLLIHEVLEKYFRDELEIFQMSDYYRDNYDRMVVSPAPPFIKTDTYFKQGWEFFENFEFNRDDYEVLVIEDKIDVDLSDFNIVVKPDLVLKDKKTGKVILLDYKTSIIEKKGKIAKKDKEKLDGYKRQMTMYAKYLKTKDVFIDEVWLWFIRQEDNKITKFVINTSDEEAVVDWITDTVSLIRLEEEFPAKIDKFFCSELCSVSSFCVPFIKFKEQNV